MGSKVETYCDGCGADVGDARIGVDALQITTIGTNGTHVIILLCMNREVPEREDDHAAIYSQGKIKGCARKVLTKSVLTKLYEEVAEYTGDESIQPFAL